MCRIFFKGMKGLLRCLTTVLLLCLLVAFKDGPKDYGFMSPLGDKMIMTGNYAEIRPNHFHAGLDLRTDPVKNLPIYAIADGYVSRLKVSSVGYGRVLYVTHPNGLVSVYAHQHHFSSKITAKVEQEQRMKETFELELYLQPGDLPVKKGEVIGFSGNSGNSQAPHLHFEIRDAKTEAAYNPQKYYTIPDDIAPEIPRLHFYDLTDMEHPKVVQSVSTGIGKKKKSPKPGGVLTVNACFGLGLEAFDRDRVGGGVNQVYGIQVLLDGQLIVHYEFDAIAFEQSRYVNCFSDISAAWKSSKIQRCFLSKNEDLPIFKVMQGGGEIQLKDSLLHVLEVIAYDINGNKKEVKVQLKSNRKPNGSLSSLEQRNDCLKEWKKETDFFKVVLPERTFFNDFTVLVDEVKAGPQALSKVVTFKGKQESIFKPVEIWLKPLTGKRLDKLCVIDYYQRNFCGGHLEGEWIKGQSKNYGTFALAYDTVAPQIQVMGTGSPRKKKKRQAQTSFGLSFYVCDNLSGIDKFKLFVDELWYPTEYDQKKGWIWADKSRITPGPHKYRLEVWDKMGNKQVWSAVY